MSKIDTFMPAWQMLAAMKNQEFTASELVEVLMERIEKVNPAINAYCTTTFDLARGMAKDADDRIKKGGKIPALNGIPTSIKDLYDVAGVRTTQGSKLYENHVAENDSVAVERLRAAGAVFMGKTNTPEFGYAGVTHNKVFGITKNPWNLEKNPGGSSGGAAAAVATGISPLALGSDGGGSLRHPAAFCGIACIKPNYGRVPDYPRDGVRGETITHLGPNTLYIKDAALMLDVMKGPHPGDRYSLPSDSISYFEKVDEPPARKLKIGYSLDLGYAKVLDKGVMDNTMAAIETIEKLDLGTVDAATIKMRNPENGYYVWYTGMYGHDFGGKIKKHGDDMDPNLVKMIEAGTSALGTDVFKALHERMKVNEVFHQYFKEYDMLLTPTTAIPAFELGIMYPPTVKGISPRKGTEVEVNISPTGWMPFTFPFNFTGHPAASVPSGFTADGLPTGLQIVGRRFEELEVLQLAAAFEKAAPWQGKRPPVP